MDSLAMVLTAWLGFGACGFTAGAVGVGVVRRRLQQLEPETHLTEQDELITAA